MGFSGFGPFDNDSALDFVDEFLEVESPAGSIRTSLVPLGKDCYHDIDEVCHAWAACELVAIATSGGEGYDPDDLYYEAASRLRPNKKLVDQCLNTLTHILDGNSELSELVDAKDRVGVEANLALIRARLKQGLALNKFPRLKVPKIKALRAYAVAAGGKWIVALHDWTTLIVLSAVYDRQPESAEDISMENASILFSCRYMGSVDNFAALGRLRPTEAFTESHVFVTTVRYSCSSSSDMGNFETNYRLDRGGNGTYHSYDDVRKYPFCAVLSAEQFAELLTDYIANASIELPPVPTPTELRDEFVEGCREVWAPYLDGDGGGPFSFPRLYANDVSLYVLSWIKNFLSTNWTNSGMCLPDDLNHYFLTGMVAACVGAYAERDVPEVLVPLLEPLRAQISHADVSGAIHILSCVLDEASVIPHVLQEDPLRRAAFLDQANALRDALTATLSN